MTRPSFSWQPEDDRPPPQAPFLRKVGEDLWEGYFPLAVWSLLMWVMSLLGLLAGMVWLPLMGFVAALSVVPALAGLMVACGNAARGGFVRLADAARGTRQLYWRAVALSLPMAIVLMLILVTAEVVQLFPERREMLLSGALQLGLGLTGLVLHVYLLPLLALYDTPLKRTLQLAVAMVGRFVWQTLALLALGVGLLALLTLHPLFWLLVPGVWCVVVMNATWRLTRHVLAEGES